MEKKLDESLLLVTPISQAELHQLRNGNALAVGTAIRGEGGFSTNGYSDAKKNVGPL
jgi:hypothetical protein